MKLYLIIPFSTNSNNKIHINNSQLEFTNGFYDFSLKETGINSYSLKVGLFNSESEAENVFHNLKTVFHWITLQHKIGFIIPNKISKADLYETPIEVADNSICSNLRLKYVDGSYDGNKAVIICNEKEMLCTTAPTGTATVGIDPKNIEVAFKESIALNSSENILKDGKLKLALELYSSYFFEHSQYSRFINLVNVLEALAPSEGEVKISVCSQAAVDQAKNKVKEIRDTLNRNTQVWKDLDNLISRIADLKKKSVSALLKDYVIDTLSKDSKLGKSAEICSKVDTIYTLRSKLLHGEYVDQNQMNEQLSFLNLLIPKLLTIEYINKIKT